MYVPKKDRIRHRILVALNKKTNGQAYLGADIDHDAWFMPVEELCKSARITDKEYRLVNSLLYDKEEVKIATKNNKEHIRLDQRGITALNENTYKTEGRKKVNNAINDVVEWVVPLGLILITIYTTVINIQLTQKIEQATQQ